MSPPRRSRVIEAYGPSRRVAARADAVRKWNTWYTWEAEEKKVRKILRRYGARCIYTTACECFAGIHEIGCDGKRPVKSA
jgi:hypothetical protein